MSDRPHPEPTLAQIVAALEVTYKPSGVLIWLTAGAKADGVSVANSYLLSEGRMDELADRVRAIGDADPDDVRIVEERGKPLEQEWLTRLHERAHKQNSRPWRIIDVLVHKVDELTLDLAAAESRARVAGAEASELLMAADSLISLIRYRQPGLTEQNARDADALLAKLRPVTDQIARSR